MTTPETSRLFSRWINPVNGVESFVLTERVAPVQKCFYYTNPGMTHDGRYLWISCVYPTDGGPNVLPVLAVIDFEMDEMRVYHETQHRTHSPAVDANTGEAYWTLGLDVWKRGPRVEDKAVLVNRFPADLAGGRPSERIATHLTFSADHRAVNVDARFGTECFIGELPLDGSEFQLWQRFDGRFYDHGQFSPTDPSLQLFAHEFWSDHAAQPFDGERCYHRMWLIRRGEEARPVLPQPISHSGHEWWDDGGAHVWFVHYGVGVKKVNVATGESQNLWPGHLSHADADVTGRYLVADMMASPADADCHVAFKNTDTGNVLEIINRPPLPPNAPRSPHLHPHPHFCCRDRYICHSTFLHDRVDVALVPTRQLIAGTA